KDFISSMPFIFNENIQNIYKHIDKVNHTIFIKIGTKSNTTHNREIVFYKFWTEQLFNRYTPHVPSLIYAGTCDSRMGELVINNNTQLSNEIPLHNEQDDNYVLLATEMMENSNSLKYYVEKY